jgi:transposase
LPYSPEQGYLLPPNVEDVLGADHLCLFLRRVVDRLDLRALTRDYAEEGAPPYHPAMMVSVWLYAYALGLTSARRLEQRVREDLGFRYLAGGQQPDYWTLNNFRRRHPKALNDLFTQVLELVRQAGLGRLGHVAIDSTRVKASAAPDRVDSKKKLRAARLHLRRQIRRWQQACDRDDPNEAPGLELAAAEKARLEKKLAELPARWEQLKKSGLKQRSRTDPDSRFLKQGPGFVLGYTVTVAASEDQVILEQRVAQETTDSNALLPTLEGVKQRCGQFPEKTVAEEDRRRQWFLCPRPPAGAGETKAGRLRPRFQPGARAQSRGTFARSGAAGGASTPATEVAEPGGTRDLSPTQSAH